MQRLVVVMLALFLVPFASAQKPETLASLEEPHEGTDRVWEIIVNETEADKDRILIYRNQVGNRFNLSVVDAKGKEVFTKRGDRGVQTIPGLPAGIYKFFIRGDGVFQITDKGFEKTLPENNITTTLAGTDAYVLTSTKYYNVSFTGNVSIEWLSLLSNPDTFQSPGARASEAGYPYVITIRGTEGTPYTITLDPLTPPPKEIAETPWPGLALVLAALGAALVLRRRT